MSSTNTHTQTLVNGHYRYEPWLAGGCYDFIPPTADDKLDALPVNQPINNVKFFHSFQLKLNQ